MEHLAIMDNKTINMILNKEKLIETRFSKNKITPYNKVKPGDLIYLKASGKDITAYFEVDRVVYYENLDASKIDKLKEYFNNLIKAPDSYWQMKLSSNYGTLIYIKNSNNLDKPIKINKKNRQGFVSYSSIEKGL